MSAMPTPMSVVMLSFRNTMAMMIAARPDVPTMGAERFAPMAETAR